MTTDTIMLQKTILATIRADMGFRTTKDPQTLSEELAGLITELKKGVCLFSYRKKDGEVRRATGTLSRDIMDRYLDGTGGTPKGHRKSARPTSSAYFDLEKGEFRCFLWENFIRREDDYEE